MHYMTALGAPLPHRIRMRMSVERFDATHARVTQELSAFFQQRGVQRSSTQLHLRDIDQILFLEVYEAWLTAHVGAKGTDWDVSFSDYTICMVSFAHKDAAMLFKLSFEKQ